MNLFNKAAEIIEGWNAYTNLVTDSVNIEQAEERANICATCPFIEKASLISWLMPDETLKQVQGYKCSKCGCPLSTKVRSTRSKCPENKWPEKE